MLLPASHNKRLKMLKPSSTMQRLPIYYTKRQIQIPVPVHKPKAAVPTNYSYKIGAKQNLAIQYISRSLVTKMSWSLLNAVAYILCTNVYSQHLQINKLLN